MGEIAGDSRAVLKLAVNDQVLSNPPTVYINSKKAKFVGVSYVPDNFSAKKVVCYELPKSAHDDIFIVVEVSAPGYLYIDHAEVCISAKGE